MRWSRFSVGFQIAVVATLISLVVGLLLAFTFARIIGATLDRDGLTVQSFADAYCREIASRVDQVDRTLTYFATAPEVQDFVLAPNPSARFDAMIRVDDALNRMRTLVPQILDVVLLLAEDGATGYHQPLSQSDLQLLTTLSRDPRMPLGRVVFSPVVSSEHLGGGAQEGLRVLLAGFPVYSIRSGAFSTQPLGHLFFVLDPLGFSQKAPPGTGGLIWSLIDARGTILDQSGTQVTTGANLVQREVADLGARFSARLDRTELDARLAQDLWLSFGSFFLALVAMIGLLLWIGRSVARNNRVLLAFSRTLDSQNLLADPRSLHLSGSSDAAVLADTVNGMLDTIRTLLTDLLDARGRLHETEIARRQAEIEMLVSQINPHFFYNTMEVLNGIAAARGVDEIQDIVEALVRMFRYSLKADEVVPLARELEVVQGYVDIQGHRFNGLIRFGLALGAGTEGLLVPKMIVQPLVENAVIHGLEPLGRPGTLAVRTRLEAGTLVVEVEDSGLGFAPGRLADLEDDLKAIREGRFDGSRRHIGLRNVQRRLTLHYGLAGTLEIRKAPSEGTLAVLTIPQVAEKES